MCNLLSKFLNKLFYFYNGESCCSLFTWIWGRIPHTTDRFKMGKEDNLHKVQGIPIVFMIKRSSNEKIRFPQQISALIQVGFFKLKRDSCTQLFFSIPFFSIPAQLPIFHGKMNCIESQNYVESYQNSIEPYQIDIESYRSRIEAYRRSLCDIK